jgi:hypothetical protein
VSVSRDAAKPRAINDAEPPSSVSFCNSNLLNVNGLRIDGSTVSATISISRHARRQGSN